MANTRQSTKRARQNGERRERNIQTRAAMRTAVRGAVEAVQKKDAANASTAFSKAIQALSKAASKGAIPKARAARKISRLTLLANKTLPQATQPVAKAAPKAAKASATAKV